MKQQYSFVANSLSLAKISILVFGFAAATAQAAAPNPLSHPLDPLTGPEIAAASKLITAYKDCPKGVFFPTISLKEPTKSETANYQAGTAFRREAFATVLDRPAGKTYEAVVDLNAGKVISWKNIPGVQPMVLVEEYDTVPKIVKADPRWQKAMIDRGYTDFDKLQIDTWAVGSFMPPGTEGARLLRAITYLKDGQINFYGRPIEGVIAVVNMNTSKVIQLTDSGIHSIPPASTEFDEKSNGPLREVKPLFISQPQGAG